MTLQAGGGKSGNGRSKSARCVPPYAGGMTQPTETAQRPEASRPGVQPLQTNDLATIAVGMALWLVAIGVLYGLRVSGAAHIAMWWIWTCVAGFVLGFYGLYFLWRRSQRARR